MSSLWKCATCGYRFEDWQSLSRHQNEGTGCPGPNEEDEEPEYIDRAWEEYYHTHSSSITGIFEGL